MSIESLFDHVATVYRMTQTVEGDERRKQNSYAPTVDEACSIYPGGARFRDGRRESAPTVSVRYEADVQVNDVLDVTEGPNAPLRLKVVARERLRMHHTELACEPFNGVLS